MNHVLGPMLLAWLGLILPSIIHAQVSAYAATAWTQASSPTVRLAGGGISVGRQYVFGYEDIRGSGIQVDSPYSAFTYCDANRLCPRQRTSIEQGIRTFFVGRRITAAMIERTTISIIPRLAASFVRETRQGLETPGTLEGNQGSITAGIVAEATRPVTGRWAVTLAVEARRQIREPSPCIECDPPFRDGFTLQQLSLGVTRLKR